MAVVNKRPLSKKKTAPMKKAVEYQTITTQKASVNTEEVMDNVDDNVIDEAENVLPKQRFLGRFHIAKEITEEKEYYAEVSKWESSDYGNKVILSPYLYGADGNKIIYEDVFLRIRNNCPEWGAEAKFIRLFSEARHWGDIWGRIVGIRIKFNKKGETLYKNVVDVFVTEEDDLVFDDEHIPYGAGKDVKEDTDKKVSNPDTKLKRTSKLAALLDEEEDDEDDGDEDDGDEE